MWDSLHAIGGDHDLWKPASLRETFGNDFYNVSGPWFVCFQPSEHVRTKWRTIKLCMGYFCHESSAPILQVLHGLAYLHDQGVVHRDIKGANILTTKEVSYPWHKSMCVKRQFQPQSPSLSLTYSAPWLCFLHSTSEKNASVKLLLSERRAYSSFQSQWIQIEHTMHGTTIMTSWQSPLSKLFSVCHRDLQLFH